MAKGKSARSKAAKARRSKEQELADLFADRDRFIDNKKKMGFALAKKYMTHATNEEIQAHLELVWWPQFGPGFLAQWQRKHPNWVPLQQEVYQMRLERQAAEDAGNAESNEDKI